MDDLVQRIEASIENRCADLWFPELTADLAARAWDSLHREIGLTPDSYGTERVLSRSISAPRKIIKSLSTSSFIGTAPAMSIDALSQECATEYQDKGISFYSPGEIVQTTVLSSLEEALAIINQVPSLMRTIAVLVRSLHVIRPDDDEHDVSFSEPHVPFSIFVSVPGKRIAHDSLRVAEAIVHEAMHLQLTLIERVVPVTVAMSGQYYSPWKKENRNAEGILQALFVFAAIDGFLNKLMSAKTELAKEFYISRRRNEIRQQIWRVRSFCDSDELTEVGFKLVTWLTRVDEHKSTPARITA